MAAACRPGGSLRVLRFLLGLRAPSVDLGAKDHGHCTAEQAAFVLGRAAAVEAICDEVWARATVWCAGVPICVRAFRAAPCAVCCALAARNARAAE